MTGLDYHEHDGVVKYARRPYDNVIASGNSSDSRGRRISVAVALSMRCGDRRA